MTGVNLIEWVNLLEKAKFAQAVDDTSTTDVLSSDVPEQKVFIPLSFIISDTSGSANAADIKKVEEGGGTTDYHTTFNLGGDETVILSPEEIAPFVPRLEGGTNLQFTASNDGVEITMVYIENVEV